MIRVYTGRITGTVDRAGANATAADVGMTEVTDLCRRIMNQATVNAPVDTGFLRGQHRMTVAKSGTQVVGTVSNNAKYAEAVHDGTRPHVIRATRRSALRFVVNGRTVYARSVRHPGTRARPWLADAAEKAAASAGFRFRRVTSG